MKFSLRRASILFLLIFLAGCVQLETPQVIFVTATPLPTPTHAAPTAPSILRVGVVSLPATKNPLQAFRPEDESFFRLIYETLYERGLDGNPHPLLVEDTAVSQDGLAWTFQIHRQSTWQDGQPLTAADVVFSLDLYRRYAELVNQYPAAQIIASIIQNDDYTFTLTLTQPAADLEERLISLWILPRQVWMALDNGTPNQVLAFANEDMLGSGPFRLNTFSTEGISLLANSTYWLRPSLIDGVELLPFSDGASKISALTQETIDAGLVPGEAISALGDSSHFMFLRGEPAFPQAATLVINQLDPASCPPGVTCSGHPALLDPALRLALAFATDKSTIIDTFLYGLGSPGLTLIPPSQGMWFNTDLADHRFDLVKAAQLLDDAGYVDTNGDGTREMPGDGTPLVFRLNTFSEPAINPAIAEFLAEDYRQIGLGIEFNVFGEEGLGSPFDYDLILVESSLSGVVNDLLQMYTTQGLTEGKPNSGYSNPEVDTLYDQQSVEKDAQIRRDEVWQIERIVFEDTATIVLYDSLALAAVRADRFSRWTNQIELLDLLHPELLARLQPMP
jgi:peptide/nickel transport system substrate-binding protein